MIAKVPKVQLRQEKQKKQGQIAFEIGSMSKISESSDVLFLKKTRKKAEKSMSNWIGNIKIRSVKSISDDCTFLTRFFQNANFIFSLRCVDYYVALNYTKTFTNLFVYDKSCHYQCHCGSLQISLRLFCASKR